eukprot:CAMPEP_0183716940 /NCGR_PEP_ID=MMETSP0737-20130205/10680_1 /TAXON_ID=385413 /ORGANISM="Thalassiosira miniscula, Strain CCMP1093" /LENGTH=265 /DNA_ID=CAMNT_0025946277 /DNA_START=53 /DNA_END=850 /DNA_ORIENTATION=-
MARGKGKRGGRGSGKRFAAQSAEEIEQRNARLAEFDAARAKRRADAEEDGDDDDGSVDSAQREAEREAMLVGRRVAEMSVGDDEGEWVEKEFKPKGVEGLIEVDNPNKAPVKMTKLKDMDSGEAAPMTRREREEKEKEAKAAAYRKRHEAGLTEEYKRDMAKLAEVKARREAAKAKGAAEKEAAEMAEEERKKAVEAANAANSDDEEGEKKKKKKGKSAIPKIDKIAIKKMKPAQLKESLKERGLEIQGNAKTLQARLLKYEQER